MGKFKNTDEWIRSMNERLRNAIDIKNYTLLTNEVVSRQSNRIFEKGTAGVGAGYNYSTNPIYASNDPKYTPRKNPPRGKKSSLPTFKNGKQRKSTYFAGGYAEFKTAVGKNRNNRVNLWLFGNFKRMFQNSGKNPVKRINQTGFSLLIQFKASKNNPQGKLDSILTRYPDMFKLSPGERKFVVRRFREILLEKLG